MNKLQISDAGPKQAVGHKESGALEPSSTTLEGLPTELKTLILQSSPNLAVLRNLTRSSPVYRTIYLRERQTILPMVQLRDVRDDIGAYVLPDALAVHKAFQIGFKDSEEREVPVGSLISLNKARLPVEGFISWYKAERTSPTPISWDALDAQTIESLSNLHHLVREITLDFCQDVYFVHPVTGEKYPPP
jgi:hypothetical protein